LNGALKSMNLLIASILFGSPLLRVAGWGLSVKPLAEGELVNSVFDAIHEFDAMGLRAELLVRGCLYVSRARLCFTTTCALRFLQRGLTGACY
jgi:hypothetical protein